MGAKISIIYFKIIEVDVTNLLHLRAKMNFEVFDRYKGKK